MSTSQRARVALGGAVVGLLSWVLGYAITYLLVAPEIRDSPIHRFVEAFAGDPATYEMVGWVFFNAHFVNTVFRNLPLIGSTTTTFLGDDGFSIILYALPVVILIGGGAVLAYVSNATNPWQGVMAGITVTIGYLLLTIVGVFLFEVTLGGASGAPDVLPAIFLGGIVYPLIFGGIGGAVVGYADTRG